MSNGLNKAILIGNLGADPELRVTTKGHPVLRCRLATSESYLDKGGERQERTEWHTVIVWGKRAEGLKRILQKGGRIGVEGRIRTRKWADKSGGERWTTEVEALEVLLLNGRRSDGLPPREAAAGDPGGHGAGAPSDDDIPF